MKTNEDIKEKLATIINDISGSELTAESLVEETSFMEDLGFDMLDMIELAMDIERGFEISLSDEEVEKISTVSDAINLISYHIN